MAIRALIFGTDDIYPALKNFYKQEVKKGNLEIIGYAIIGEDGKISVGKTERGGGCRFRN